MSEIREEDWGKAYRDIIQLSETTSRSAYSAEGNALVENEAILVFKLELDLRWRDQSNGYTYHTWDGHSQVLVNRTWHHLSQRYLRSQ